MTEKIALLLDGLSTKTWIDTLEEVLRQYGSELHVHTVIQKTRVVWDRYHLVLLDAGAVHDIVDLVCWVRKQAPRAYLVVISPDPRWKQAREVMLAGASDYIRRSGDRAYLSRSFDRFFQAEA